MDSYKLLHEHVTRHSHQRDENYNKPKFDHELIACRLKEDEGFLKSKLLSFFLFTKWGGSY